jgi:hypothetical protein
LSLVCDDNVVENSVLSGRFELNAPLEGVAIITWHTHDGTATAWWQNNKKEWVENNYEESGDFILAEPGQKEFDFTIKILALTDEQRAAGGATFQIQIRTLVGAVAETREKVIKIIPTVTPAQESSN